MLRNMLVTGMVIGLLGCQVESNPELIEIESARQTFSFDNGYDPGFYTGRMTNYYQTMALTTGLGSNFLPSAVSPDVLVYGSVTLSGLSFNDVVVIEPGLVSINVTTSNTIADGSRGPEAIIHLLDSSSNTLFYRTDNSISTSTTGSETETYTFFNHADTTASLELSALATSTLNSAMAVSLDHEVWLEKVDIQTARVDTDDWEATTYNYNTDPTDSSCNLSYGKITTAVSPSVVAGKMQLDIAALYDGQPLLNATVVENDATPSVFTGTANVQYPAIGGVFNATLDNSFPSSADLLIEFGDCTLSLEHYRSIPSLNDLQTIKTIDLKTISDFESNRIATIDQLDKNTLTYVNNGNGKQLDVTEQINFTKKSFKLGEEKVLLAFDVNPLPSADYFSIAFDVNLEGLDTEKCDSLQINMNASGGNWEDYSTDVSHSKRLQGSLFRNAELTSFALLANTQCTDLGDDFTLAIDNLVVSNFQKP